MRGEVLAYDDGSGTGLISGDDGARYAFARADLQQLTPLHAGNRVDFVPVDGAATQVFIVAQSAGGPQAEASRPGGYTPGVAGSGGGAFDWKTLFLDANGRIGQKDYWIGFGILFVANMVLSWLPMIGFLVSLGAIYGGVCVASKRLHDMGRSGWLAAIPYGVFLAAVVVSMVSVIGVMGFAGYDNGAGAMASMGLVGLLWTLAFVLNFAFVIWLGITTGQPGDNPYGPPPKSLTNL